MIILGDIHDKGVCDWSHYNWLEQHTTTDKQVQLLNEKFKKYNWQFKKGGFKYWGGDQCTGAVLKILVNKK